MEELKSLYDLYSKSDEIHRDTEMNNEGERKEFLLKDVFVLTKQIKYDEIGIGTGIIGKFNEKGKFELFSLEYPVSLFKNIEPIYEVLIDEKKEFLESQSDKVHNIKKYEVVVAITSVFNENNKNTQQVKSIIRIESIKEENGDKKEPTKEAIEVLKKQPYLVGLIGVDKINIPVIADSEIILQGLQKQCHLPLEPIGDDLNKTISRKIDIYSLGKNKIEPMYIPETLGKEKVYFAYNNIPRNALNIFNSDKLMINGYTFKNDSKIIIILIKNIHEFLKSKIVTQKRGTYITGYLLQNYAKEIEELIKSSPITIDDFKKYTGYSITDMDKMLSIYEYSLLIGIEAIDYRIIKILFDTLKYNIPDDMTDIVYSVSLAFSAFKMANKDDETEDIIELKKKIKNFLNNNLTDLNSDYQIGKTNMINEIKNRLLISDNLASKIINDLDSAGYININEETETITFEKEIVDLFN